MKAAPTLTRVLLSRLFSKIHINPDTDCWEWTASITKATGYGQIRVNGGMFLAHRLFYLLFVGSIPDGLQCDHLCRVRHCVNPAHMEVVTPRENMMRGNTLAAKCAAQTHCKRGHPLSGDNLYVGYLKRKTGSPQPNRSCKICRNFHAQQYQQRQRLQRTLGGQTDASRLSTSA